MAGTSQRRTAPGVRHFLPFLGASARARRDPLGFLNGGFRTHGDVFRYQIGHLVFHLLAHPDQVKYVLVDNSRNYPRSWFYDRMKVIVGEGLVTTEGAPWRRLRRLSQPAFHHHRLADLAGVMTETTRAMCDRWAELVDTGRSLDVAAEFEALTLRIVGRTLLGIDLDGKTDRLGVAITTLLEYGEYRINSAFPLPPLIPTTRNRRFQNALRALDAIVFELIAERRRSGRDHRDLLALLMAARDDETANGFTDRELRDQVLTFIGAGQETTAVALTWTVYLLSQHPDAYGRLRDEVTTVLGSRVPTAADLPRLAFTRRVIEEALRLYPPVYALVRDVKEDDEIGGFHIPARSMVVLSPYVTHRHPAAWPDPESFDPDRFLPDLAAGRPRFAWYPFLGGAHQCIGQEFAMMEAALVVAMIIQSFRLDLAPGVRVEPRPRLTLRTCDGLRMTVGVAERIDHRGTDDGDQRVKEETDHGGIEMEEGDDSPQRHRDREKKEREEIDHRGTEKRIGS